MNGKTAKKLRRLAAAFKETDKRTYRRWNSLTAVEKGQFRGLIPDRKPAVTSLVESK